MFSPTSLVVLLVLVLHYVITINAFTFNSSVLDRQVKCIESERQALVKLKDNLNDVNGLLSSWGNEQEKRECCKWYGIQCDNKSGHVVTLHLSGAKDMVLFKGNISDSLIGLPYLNYLNLSWNPLFGGRNFPSFIANLSRLEVLDLRQSFYFDHLYSMEWVSHLSSLRQLHLSNMNFSTTNWIGVVNKLPNLRKLSLDYCYLQDVTPSSLQIVNSSTSLDFISLYGNNLSISIFNWLLKLNSSNLLHLDLRSNQLNGLIPEALKNMIVLTHLDLSYNILQGKIPKFLSNMSSLQYLDLSYNKLEGEIPNFLSDMSSLQYLYLCGINLQGEIPKSLWSICSLQELYLSNNNISGPLSPYNNCSHHSLERLDLFYNQITSSMPNFTLFTSLEYIDLSSNQLSGVVPPSLGQLSELQSLKISNNSFHGVISKVHFLKLSKLTTLDFSDNPSLILDIDNNWVPPFQLYFLAMRSCRLGPHFPKWIRTRKNCRTLDLSNTGIKDSLPNYFWDQVFCRNINISNNQITGRIVNISLQVKYFDTIDLSSNLFVGPVAPFLFKAKYLLLFRNKFSNLNSMCDVSNGESFLFFLDVSDNHLLGQLPDCWSYFQQLNVLVLSNNNLSGRIPNSIGYLSQLESLHLDGNNLIRALPTSLKNCTLLEFMNAGDNELLGPIPKWIGENLAKLVVLSLSSNHFYGSIPASLCRLQRLQLLDLSINNLYGNVPKCFNNFTAMQTTGGKDGVPSIRPFGIENYEYDEHAQLIWKRIRSTYQNNLELVRSIDLSSNKLNGIIPPKITQLIGLVSLNVSRNNLTGSIPLEMGQLKSLDFIDLSNNQIYGHIPASFAQLDRLSMLDLSNNHLSGKIPKSTQLQSFNSSSYMGNPLLCGEPLPKCPGEESVPPVETPIRARSQENEMEILGQGFYFSMGLGFAVGFWGFCGALMFNKSWRYAYFNFMNVTGDYVATMIALQRSRLKRMIIKC